MGAGPNYGLDKGFLITGSAVAVAFGEVAAMDTAEQSCKRSTTAADPNNLGIFQEDVDTVRLATGRVIVGVRMTGFSRAIAGAAIAKGDRLTNDVQGRVVKQVTAGGPVLAIAQTAAPAAGNHVDVLLTPGATL